MNAKNGRKIVVGFAAAALVAGGGALASAGTASAQPLLGSADAVADMVNGLGLANVATSADVKAPVLTVDPHDDGTVSLKLRNDNTGGFSACALAITPALGAPADGVVTPGVIAGAVYPAGDKLAVDFFTTSTLDKKTQVLGPGVYAVSSHCSKWETGGDFLGGEDPTGSTANQPYYFVTLGGLFN